MTAGLKVHVEGRALGGVADLREGIGLCVGLSHCMVPTFGEDRAVAHNDAAHHGVGPSCESSTRGQLQAPRHPTHVLARPGHASFWAQAWRVFSIKDAMVMGPTPPGTGVIQLHLGATLSKSTSPVRRLPDFFVASAMRLMPTSITTAPSFTMSAVTK